MQQTAPNPPALPCEANLDPRIRRTREQLQQSLARLLETHDFERISVHDITDAAGVNRATFYAHYPDKFALLECVVAGRFHALLDERGVVVHGSCTNAMRGLILGVCDFLAQSIAQNPCPSSAPTPAHPIHPYMETAVIAVVRRMVLDGIQQHGEPTNAVNNALRASAISWAIYGAAREWANTPDRAPSEEVATTVVNLIAPLFAPATVPAHA
jgi:AcrR family transcriptional regulator